MAIYILGAPKCDTVSSRILLPGLRITSMLTVVLLVCLETVLLCTVSNCAKSFYVHWNTTNSIFRIDNTDHIIDVNKGNVQFEYDQVNIICPTYMPGQYEGEPEKYIIYNVSKEEYETCRITNPNPRIIAICDKPFKTMYFTITFRPFTPQPGGLEFLPGNDYYFISTSSKDDLHRRIGGRCSTHNMKVVFKVCCAPEATSEKASTTMSVPRIPTANTPMTRITWPVWQTPGPTSPAVTPSMITTPKSVQPRPSRKQINKKTDEYDKHPNEVVKNEELTYNEASSVHRQYNFGIVLPAYFIMSVGYLIRHQFR